MLKARPVGEIFELPPFEFFLIRITMKPRAKRRRNSPAPNSNSGSRNTQFEWTADWIICTALVIIVWIAFGNVVRHDFVSYDDGQYIYENTHVTSGLTLSGILWAFTHAHAANWHPLTTISHMLDCQIYGLQPWGHHLTNVMLHALATVLLFLALKKLTLDTASPAVIDRRYNLWASAFVAALFAIHPLRVESVAWISERKDVLSGVFFALTLLAYASYARSERQFGRDAALRGPVGAARRPYLATILFFALGLMSKPTLVTLPFVLLLLDYWPLQRMQGARSKEDGVKRQAESGKSQEQIPRVVSPVRRSFSEGGTSHLSAVASAKEEHLNISTSFGRLLVEKIPLFGLSAASCLVTLRAQKQALDVGLEIPFITRLENAFISYLDYIRQMLYPAHLAVLYPYPQRPPQGTMFILAALLVIGLSLLFFALRKRQPFLLTGWLWYLGMLVPMIGLVQVGSQPRADRYTYLSQIGLYILTVWWIGRLAPPSRWKHPTLTIAAATVIVASITATRLQATYWQNSVTLWTHTIENTPDNYVAHYNLGSVLLHKNQPRAAISQFEEAERINPSLSNAYVDSGSAFMLLREVDRAIDCYNQALRLRPDAETWSNLGSALLEKGQVDEAIASYRNAVALAPKSADIQYNLGRALSAKHEWPEAIACYQTGLKLKPNDPKLLNSMGAAFAKAGRIDESLQQINEALRIDPNFAEAHYNLGVVLDYMGRRDEAILQYEEALRLKPNYSEAKAQLQQLGVSISP